MYVTLSHSSKFNTFSTYLSFKFFKGLAKYPISLNAILAPWQASPVFIYSALTPFNSYRSYYFLIFPSKKNTTGIVVIEKNSWESCKKLIILSCLSGFINEKPSFSKRYHPFS